MNQKQLTFLKALLTESTISKASKAAGISRKTAYNYINDSSFQIELNKMRSECINDTVRYLQGKLAICSEELVKIIEDPETAQQVKINAINAVFATCKSLTETSEVITRLQSIEEAMKGDY